MRNSLAIAALVASPVLLLTACSSDNHPAFIKGTVKEMEYDAPTVKATRIPVTNRVCTTPKPVKVSRRSSTPRPSCTNKATGKFHTSHVTIKGECYELDILLKDGTVTEVCDEAAYRALNLGDHYNQATNYSTWKQLR
jgi:hypothetical protein